jgi:hypothetical protein
MHDDAPLYYSNFRNTQPSQPNITRALFSPFNQGFCDSVSGVLRRSLKKANAQHHFKMRFPPEIYDCVRCD